MADYFISEKNLDIS